MNRVLIGRDETEQIVLRALEKGERLLTLRGPPGVGKTALAGLIASRRTAAGAWCVLVSLEGAATRVAILERINSALRLSSRSSDARVLLECLVGAIEARSLTLILDGLDAERERVTAVVSDVLDATEGSIVIACGWSMLGLPLERVVPLGPLGPDDAWELLRRRVSRLAPHRLVTRKEGEVLVQRAEGLPLALELLAARVAALGAAPVVADVEAHGVTGARLESAIRAAWELLGVRERQALSALSVFRGAFDAEAALAVVGPEATLELLQHIADASLLQLDDSLDPPFRLLDSVREFAARQAAPGSEAQARARHAAFFARPRPPRLDAASTWPRLLALRDDLLCAWEWAVHHEPSLAVPLAVTLDPLLVTRGSATLHRRVLLETLEHGNAHCASRVDLLLSLARVDAIRGRFRASLEPLNEALSLAEALGDRVRIGWTSSFLCFVLRPLGQTDACIQHGLRGLDLARAAKDYSLDGMCQQALGRAAFSAGDIELATSRQRQAGACARLANAPRLLGIALTNLAEVHISERAFDEAAEALAGARAKFTETSDTFHLARLTVHELRLSVAATGTVDNRALQRALSQVVSLEDLEGELDCRGCMVLAALGQGDVHLARQRFEELVVVTQSTDDVFAQVKLESLKRAIDVNTGSQPLRPVLELSRDGRTLVIGQRRWDLARRGPLKRILLRLVAERVEGGGRALSADEIQSAGWPEEKMFPESAAARVYMAIRRLRELGLEPWLVTTDGGYLLSASVEVRWLSGEL